VNRAVRDQSLVSSETRDRLRGIARPIAVALGRLGLTPNALTIIGFSGTCVAAAAAAAQWWLAAGVLVIAFGIFDMFDGALARATGQASQFGAFLDSTLDRTGESLTLAGVAVGCAMAGFTEGVAVAGLAVAFASSVTYARAKAESLGVKGDVGVAPRPERLVMLALGLAVAGVLGGVGPFPVAAGEVRIDDPLRHGSIPLLIGLGLIAILSAITVVQRILTVRRQLNGH
jgi:CDP-diacylglycerol--glycerol-3-phosphate 3-phosphatidyltransferase